MPHDQSVAHDEDVVEAIRDVGTARGAASGVVKREVKSIALLDRLLDLEAVRAALEARKPVIDPAAERFAALKSARKNRTLQVSRSESLEHAIWCVIFDRCGDLSALDAREVRCTMPAALCDDLEFDMSAVSREG
jgi:hypothetical protein